MYEILDALPRGAVVLDLGSGRGSFAAVDYAFTTVHVDLHRDQFDSAANAAQASAERLPFAAATFDAVILNHCVEHLEPLKPCLQEIGRVLKKTGAAYVAVPDARTFADRLYRKVFINRGGHVNLFDDAARLAELLAWYLGIPHRGTLSLYSSLSYLNAKGFRDPVARGQLRIPPLPEPLLRRLAWMLPRARYGWALYFSARPLEITTQETPNVCIRCGAAEPAVRERRYRCAACGAVNLRRG